jgi:NTP pyrophosphatase (non-canonical NTP hydrolase)
MSEITVDLGNGQKYNVSGSPDPFAGLNALATMCYENSRLHGFHDDAPVDEIAARDRAGNRRMLIVGEVAEAHEELRKGKRLDETWHSFPGINLDGIESGIVLDLDALAAEQGVVPKPEGVPSELADVIIRVLDFATEHNIDIGAIVQEKMKYNASRPYKHNKAF